MPNESNSFLQKKAQHFVFSKVLGSGDVLLSHNLSSHYHRGCSVSLPCSEWERVGPLRYDHQTPRPQRSDRVGLMIFNCHQRSLIL